MHKRQGHRRLENRKDKDGKLICLIPTCNKLRIIGKNKRVRNYCECHNYLDIVEHVNWGSLRLKALERDQYRCVKCGKQPFKDSFKKGENKVNTSALIGDHILPIALGGDEFDINNVQTLCRICDKIKTTKDRQDIAKQRRIEKILNKNNLKAK